MQGIISNVVLDANGGASELASNACCALLAGDPAVKQVTLQT